MKEMNGELAKCNAIYNNQDRIKSKSCYYSMIQKYSTSMDTAIIPTLHYNYALSLYSLKDYKNAKAEFEFVATNEKYNKNIIQSSNNYIKNINALLNDMKTAKLADKGDYFTSLDDVSKWQDPRNLRVFIKSSTGKEYILRKAFTIWDEKLEPVHFRYVKTGAEADIIASITNIDEVASNYQDNRIGVTIFNTKSIGSKKYFTRAYIKVSQQSLSKTPQTDVEILAITLHEIGHALGIVSHSKDRGDIMYPDTSSYKTVSPSNRDLNTVRKIYRMY